MKELLKLRRERKKRKPKFVRQEIHKRKKLKSKWRAPKGMHSKMRRKFKGKLKLPSVGFSSPRKVKGLTREGYKKVLVHNLAELNRIKEGEIAELSRTMGLRKKLELLKKIKESALKVTNVKKIPETIKKIEEKLAEKKKKAKERKEKKVKAKPKEKKKKPKKEISTEEKEKKEKEEKRKALEKK